MVDVATLGMIGDGLRTTYQYMGPDANSLQNLDQDLPNYLNGGDRRSVAFASLPPGWLYCESWCNSSEGESQGLRHVPEPGDQGVQIGCGAPRRGPALVGPGRLLRVGYGRAASVAVKAPAGSSWKWSVRGAGSGRALMLRRRMTADLPSRRVSERVEHGATPVAPIGPRCRWSTSWSPPTRRTCRCLPDGRHGVGVVPAASSSSSEVAALHRGDAAAALCEGRRISDAREPCFFTCVEIKVRDVLMLNHRVVLHAIDATCCSMAWRLQILAARPSQDARNQSSPSSMTSQSSRSHSHLHTVVDFHTVLHGLELPLRRVAERDAAAQLVAERRREAAAARAGAGGGAFLSVAAPPMPAKGLAAARAAEAFFSVAAPPAMPLKKLGLGDAGRAGGRRKFFAPSAMRGSEGRRPGYAAGATAGRLARSFAAARDRPKKGGRAWRRDSATLGSARAWRRLRVEELVDAGSRAGGRGRHRRRQLRLDAGTNAPLRHHRSRSWSSPPSESLSQPVESSSGLSTSAARSAPLAPVVRAAQQPSPPVERGDHERGAGRGSKGELRRDARRRVHEDAIDAGVRRHGLRGVLGLEPRQRHGRLELDAHRRVLLRVADGPRREDRHLEHVSLCAAARRRAFGRLVENPGRRLGEDAEPVSTSTSDRGCSTARVCAVETAARARSSAPEAQGRARRRPQKRRRWAAPSYVVYARQASCCHPGRRGGAWRCRTTLSDVSAAAPSAHVDGGGVLAGLHPQHDARRRVAGPQFTCTMRDSGGTATRSLVALAPNRTSRRMPRTGRRQVFWVR